MLNKHYNTRDRRLVKVDGKTIGYIQDSQFIKPVCGSRHRLRQPPAWAIQADAYEEIRPHITRIVIVDKEAGIEHHASVEIFDRYRGELDRGFGRQYYLTLNRWRVEGNGDKQLSLFPEGGN